MERNIGKSLNMWALKTTKILINDMLVDEDILKRHQKEIKQYFQNECIFIQLNEIFKKYQKLMWWNDIAKIVPMGKFRVLTACIRKENISFQ